MVRAPVVLVIVGFAAAAWGAFKDAGWWQAVAIASAIAGTVTLVPWLPAARSVAGISNLGSNLAIHLGGNAVILLLLLVPAFQVWFTARLRWRLDANC